MDEIRALKDVSIVTTGAYREAAAELRHAPEPTPPPPEEATVPEEETPQGGGLTGLTVEARSAPEPPETIEHRYFDAMRDVPRGEARSLTLTSAEPVEPVDLSTFLFDQLRTRSVVLSTGVRVVTTDKKSWKAPRLTGDISAAFYNELDDIVESDPDFDEFEITPKAIKALVKGSSEAFEDSSPDLLTIVQQNLNTVLALRLDAECLTGNSAKGFPGLTNITGHQTMAAPGTGGALADYDWWAKAVGKLAEANVPRPLSVDLSPSRGDRAWAC